MTSNIVVSFIYWHFIERSRSLLQVWRNFLFFSANFFSTPLLLKTLFSPWRRYNWSYPRGFDVGKYFETIISNIFSRIVGAICRSAMIIAGTIFQVFVLVAGVIIFLGWLFLPVLVLAGLLFSLGIL